MPYQNIKFSNMAEIHQILDDNMDKIRCHGICGRSGEDFAVQSILEGYPDYVHDGGIQIGNDRYWLYLHCTDFTCLYDTALWKLHIKGLE